MVLLNVGYGLVEIVAGWQPGTQGRRARLPGDGTMIFLGLLAIGWNLAWRARSALIQGLFLGALGLGVLASTG